MKAFTVLYIEKANNPPGAALCGSVKEKPPFKLWQNQAQKESAWGGVKQAELLSASYEVTKKNEGVVCSANQLIKKKCLKPNLKSRDDVCWLHPNWELVPEERSLKAEGSASHSTFTVKFSAKDV